MIKYGVIYRPSGAFRECATELEARFCFDNSPCAESDSATLIVDYEEVDYSPESEYNTGK